MGYLDEILHKSGVENGHSNEKIAEKTSLFFSSLAKSAMNGCSVAVFSHWFSVHLKEKLQEDSPETAGKNTEACL